MELREYTCTFDVPTLRTWAREAACDRDTPPEAAQRAILPSRIRFKLAARTKARGGHW